MNIFKKSLALLLTMCMMCSVVPMTVSATDTADITSDITADSVVDEIDTFDVMTTSNDEISAGE
ncbi:MAG: hypothetical protein IJ325_10520, partial [Clostridia bacterium]|nr:hypothetical protein [Clostridia bacterium]